MFASLREMQVIIVLLRSLIKYALFSFIPKWNAFRNPFLSDILKDMNICKRKKNPWCWNVTQLTVFPGQINSSGILGPRDCSFALIPFTVSHESYSETVMVRREQSRSNLCCLSKTQRDTKQPAQPPLGCLRHRTHFSGWKADSDTASNSCVSSGSPCRRDLPGWRGGGTNGRVHF